MAFFTADKLKRRRIKIDPSAVSAQSPEVQDRLQRIDENYRAFDELFATVQATIEADERLRQFNANLRAADLQPKKKKRWRSRSGQASAQQKPTGRRTTVGKIKNAQIALNKAGKKSNATTAKGSTTAKKRTNKKPR